MQKYLLLFILSLFSPCLHAQEIKAIKLKQQHIAYATKNYYVTRIKDDRQDTTSIGTVRVGIANKKASLTLKNGVANSINEFIQNNLDQNRSAKPIELHILKLEIAEKAVGGREQADITFGIAFYTGDTKLVDYTGRGYIQSGLDVTAYVERLIRQNLERGLSDFDRWLEDNKDALNPNKELKIKVLMQENPADTELIFYNKNRPLQREDFTGTVDDLSMGAAATFSGLSMKYRSETLNNKVTVEVIIGTFFDKTKSWWRAKTGITALAHEQHHFDITALEACVLVDAIKAATFTVENYPKELEALHKKITREMQQLQDQYDRETKHGSIKAEQERWNKDISNKVSQLTCY